ncbi:hypothetical protein B0H16DRAFT_1689376 [Mycena metata]|uniref:Uncharacterized protein n=1 Tax=Mycena metata TaxID=1033252 RepID=A0AAD7J6V8_9AGAR|nr:hypothetical protein B0H16DRAFT_1689376 [Mycena metata]
MGVEDDLPPSSPPPPIHSPPYSSFTRGLDFASGSVLQFADGLGDFESPGAFDFASGSLIPQLMSTPYQFNHGNTLDSPSFTPGPSAFRLLPVISAFFLSSATKNPLVRSKPIAILARVKTKQAQIAQVKERAAAAATLAAYQPQPSPAEQRLAPLSFGTPVQRSNASESTFLRGRALARSQRRACSISRSRSADRGHRSSSVPADTYAPEIPVFDNDDLTIPAVGCPGVLLDWAALDMYPWGVHKSRMNLPYCLDHFAGEGDLTRVCVRSLLCTGSPGVAQPECSSCRSVKVGQTVATLKMRAEFAPSHTPWGYLNQQQLVTGWKAAEDFKNAQHLKMLSMTKKAARSTSRMSDHKRLIMALSTCDIPRLSTLMRVAAKQRAGPKEMIKRIADAATGLSPNGYSPKSFTDTEKKLMRCMKRFAGRKGVYALSKALGMPSSSTIRASNPLRLLPSVAAPKAEDIGTNIRTFFGAGSPNSVFPPTGHTLMIDGIHLSQRACWHRGTNQIIGLCREHSEPFDLTMNSMESVLKIVEAVHGDSPTCHYGREATVLAIGPYRDHNYHGVPIGQTQTCKSEKGAGFAALLTMTLEQWKIHGEPHSGPALTVSTDGDSVFRDGLFKVLMTRTPDKSGALFLKLSGCSGLNLECGDDDVVIGPDGKHVVKHPADHQNVPRAYKLLKAIITVGADRPAEAPKLNPTDQDIHRSFALVGEMWSAFLDPFLSREMSLSERLASFSKFAHLAFAFYRMHGSSFLSNQLYGDMQALVKSAFFCVARQQELDPEQAFFLYQCGSDRLEEIYAEVRTESHDSNVDALQLSERLSTAADTQGIFDENPQWHQGNIRRSWFGKEADHVNPSYFTGDQRVKHVILSAAWRSGRHAAGAVFAKHGVEFDFEDALAPEDVDFIRPNGGGIYPGISKDKDRSIITPESTAAVPEPSSMIQPDSDSEDEGDEEMPDAEPEDLPHISLEDLLPEVEDQPVTLTPIISTAAPENTSVVRAQTNDWLDYVIDESGTTKRLHKSSILSTLFNSDYRRLEVSRLLRVRCYTKDGGRKLNLNHQEFSGEHSFNVGDIAVALIRTGTRVAAAVVKVTVIEKEKRRLGQIDTEDLGSMESKATITAQPLVLRDTLVVVGDGSPTRKWMWTGEYTKFEPIKGPQSIVEVGTRKALTVKVPGAFLHPLDAEIESVTHFPVSVSDSLRAKHMLHVWAVPHEDFMAVVSTLYASLDSGTVLKLLPKHGNSKTFPYIDSKGVDAFIIDTPTQALTEKALNSEKICCFQCRAFIKPEDARGHVGGHLLKSLRGIVEPNLFERVDKFDPCGFCGRGWCSTDLSGLPTARATPKCTSTCPRAHAFSYGHAKKYSANTPCTNVPIFCTLCLPIPPRKSPAVFWKYSMFAHIQTAHPRFWDESSNKPVDLSQPFALALAISREEMLALGVTIGTSEAPLASTLAPVPRRGEKRTLTDASGSTSTRRRT